jgi:hypothetical protein
VLPIASEPVLIVSLISPLVTGLDAVQDGRLVELRLKGVKA